MLRSVAPEGIGVRIVIVCSGAISSDSPFASFTSTCNVAVCSPGFLTFVTTLVRPDGTLAQKIPEPVWDLSPSRTPPLKVYWNGPRARMPSGRYWSEARVFHPDNLSAGGAPCGSVGGGCQIVLRKSPHSAPPTSTPRSLAK